MLAPDHLHASCSASTGWTRTGCSTGSAPRSSGSAWRSSSSSAGCSSRSCPVTPCCSRWACSSRRRRTASTTSRAPARSSWPSRSSLLTVAAVLGNVVGYEIGREIGPPLYQRDGRIIKREYFDKTQAFFEQARQQGAGDRPVRAVRPHLHHRRRGRDPDGPPPVLRLELVGAVLWVISITLLGYFLGRRRAVAGREHRLRHPRDPAPSRWSRSSSSGARHRAPTRRTTSDSVASRRREPAAEDGSASLSSTYEAQPGRVQVGLGEHRADLEADVGERVLARRDCGRSRRPRPPRSRRPRAARSSRRAPRRRW